MKKCFIMFAFLLFMLILAAFTDSNRQVIIDDKIVENELEAKNQLTNEIRSDNILLKN